MDQLKQIDVRWGSHHDKVLVSGAFDAYLDAFAGEVGGHLTDERCPFGVLLWPCARALASLLSEEPQIFPNKPKRIIELGCGVGFISCVLARLYPDAEILACDYERELQGLVDGNAKLWGLGDRVRFIPVDWRKAAPAELLASADWVVGTDVFYDDSHLLHLPPFAASLLRPGAYLTLADPKRYRFGRVLELLQERFELVTHEERLTSLKADGIEEFMINFGLSEQLTSILHLKLLTELARH